MIDVSTRTSISIATASYDFDAVSLARSYLEAYSGDYVFLRLAPFDILDTSEVYVLLTGSGFEYDSENEHIVLPEDFHITEFQRVMVPGALKSAEVDSFSGNGSIIGLGEGVATESFSGSITHQQEREPASYYYLVDSFDVSDETPPYVDLAGSNDMQLVCFSNLGFHPRLIEGVQNHAFTTNFILLCFCAALLFHTVFKHVSN